MTILLNNDDVAQLITMGECIEALDEAYGDLGRGEGAFRDRLELIGPTQEILKKSKFLKKKMME